MGKTQEFTLGGISNEFRYHFIRILSDRASTNKWCSKDITIETNELQNAFYFNQTIKFDTDREVECVYRDIQDTLTSLKKLGFEFDTETIKKGSAIEVTNIR